MNPLLVIKLLDLALLGGTYAASAIAARKRLTEMVSRGGPTEEELAELERSTDELIDELGKQTSSGARII